MMANKERSLIHCNGLIVKFVENVVEKMHSDERYVVLQWGAITSAGRKQISWTSISGFPLLE